MADRDVFPTKNFRWPDGDLSRPSRMPENVHRVEVYAHDLDQLRSDRDELAAALDGACSWLARDYSEESPRVVEWRALVARIKAGG